MKKLYLTIILGWLCIFAGQSQPANLVLSSAESGTKLHQATNSISFAPGYSYTPSGGTMTAEIVTAGGTAGDTRLNPIVAGQLSPGFQYTNTQNTTGFTNQYAGRSTNDVFYQFTLALAMEVTMSHCGSALPDTYMHLLDASGNLIVSNDDYSGEGMCSSGLHSYIKRQLAAGTYYVVSEGYSENGLIQTSISGIVPEPEGTIAGNMGYSTPIDPATYSINTALAVGSTGGSLNAGGSASYTIPLEVPKGTNGMQPSIGIGYTSNFSDGPLGIGWNLGGVPSIDRIGETIYHDGKSEPVRGDLTDRYALDGKRLIVTNGTYGASSSEYRTEIEEFSKVVANSNTDYGPASFTAYTKSGLVYEFGNTEDSKIRKTNGAVLSWKVNKISDRYNNYITFTYLASDDERPIGTIEYTGNSTLSKDPFARIVFNYKYRADVSRYVYGGKEFTRDILLDNIEVRNNGQTFKKYVLAYMRDTNAQLLKVTETSSQNAALNPTVFAWTKQTDQKTESVPYSSSVDEYYYTGDFNGDGRADLVTVPVKSSYTSADKWNLYLADASGNLGTLTAQGDLNTYFDSFMVNDFNGDGMTDLMMREKHPDSLWPNRKILYLYQSTGTNFTRRSSFPIVHNPGDPKLLDVVDYNGDGILEILTHNDSGSWNLYKIDGASVSNGNGSIPSFGEYYVTDNGMQTRILDFNGDGCSDLLTLDGNGYKLYEFKGTNNTLVQTYSGTNMDNMDFLLFGDYNGDGATDIFKAVSGYYTDRYIMTLTSDGFQSTQTHDFNGFDLGLENNRIYAREMNGDGKTDIVIVGRGTDTWNSYNRINVAISSGNGFSIMEYTSTTDMVWTDYQGGDDICARFYNFDDFNGDGRQQLFYKYAGTSRLFSFASGTPSHLLSTVIDGLGAKSTVSYLPMSSSNVYTRGTGAAYPVSDFSSSMQLVSQVSRDNGIGGTTSISYLYTGAKVHRQGKGFLGFSQITATNSATGISNESHYEFDDTYFFPKLRYVYTKHGGTTLSTTENTWKVTDYGNKRIFPYVSPGVQTDNLTGLSVTTTVSYDPGDTYGNPTTIVKNYGGGYTQTTSYAYNHELPGSWLIGRPTTITETSVRDSHTKVFTTARTYFSTNNSPDIDNYNTGDAAWWKLDRAYDSFGNLSEETKETTGLSAQTTRYSFDTDHGVNLMKVTDPAGNETGYTYEPTIGTLKTTTDPFGNVVTRNYNNNDQLSSVVPTEGVTNTMTGSLNVADGPTNARYYIQKSGNDGSLSKTWFDKLGRELRTETKNFGGAMIKVDKQYNTKGQLSQVSEPTTGTPSNWNVIGYDNYGRVTTQDPHFGTVTNYDYSGAEITRSVNSRNYTSTVDAAGLATQRTDPGGTITYAYWPDGTLKSTSTPGSVTTSMTYDKNGNRLTIDDPSAGIITNTYYGTGQPHTVKNAGNETTTYYYQTNGLLDYYTTPEGTIDYSYNTDNLVNNITSPGGVSRSYAYDSYGRVHTVTESIGGISNLVTFEYDSKGRLWRKYFNGTSEYEQYDYDTNNGYLYRIQFTAGGITNTVWQLTAMDEYSRVRQATIGSASASWSYDGSNMLSQIAAAGIQQYDYWFDVNTGNLNSRTNFLKSKTESFDYDTDNLDRLASVTGPVNQTLGYTPDKNGNIQTKSDAGTYVYDGTQPYAVDQITDGLNISNDQQTIDYYSFEKVMKITEGEGAAQKTAEFDYNADRQRIRMVLKTNGAATKTRWYFGGSCERELIGGVTTQYIWIGGDAYTAVAVAKKVGEGTWTVYNIFRDHLGTITHLKNGSNPADEYSFDAWGRRRDKDDWTMTLSSEPALFADRGFTSHEYLEDFKLYNMNGRLYDPVVGRFLSADPYVQMPDFSQNFNRYSYCLNNPLRYTDPSGNKWKWKWLNPVYWLGEGMQLLNDNSEGLRNEMSKLGIPDFNVGVTVNGAGNVNVNGDIMGQEVFNTANKDRSNAEQVVNKEINQVRQDYWQAWHGRSSKDWFDYTIGLTGTITNYVDLGYTVNQTLVDIGAPALKFSAITGKVLGSTGYFAAGASTYLDYNDPKVSTYRFSYRTTGTVVGLTVGYLSGYAAVGAIAGGTFWAGEQMYDALDYCKNQYDQFNRDLNNAIRSGWRPGY